VVTLFTNIASSSPPSNQTIVNQPVNQPTNQSTPVKINQYHPLSMSAKQH
jgi:hypothetical protein